MHVSPEGDGKGNDFATIETGSLQRKIVISTTSFSFSTRFRHRTESQDEMEWQGFRPTVPVTPSQGLTKLN